MTDKQARLIEPAQVKGTFERTSEEVFAVMYRLRPAFGSGEDWN